MPFTVSEKTINEWFGDGSPEKFIRTETREMGFKWADSPLRPISHHPARPNAESINVLGTELTQGEESRQAWVAKANSTVTPGCWNSPGTTLWRACALARQVQAAIPPTPNLGPSFFYSMLFRFPALGVSLSLSLSIFRIHSTPADEFYLQR